MAPISDGIQHCPDLIENDILNAVLVLVAKEVWHTGMGRGYLLGSSSMRKKWNV